MEIDPALFAQQRRSKFGNANPERMRQAFWEWMVRGDDSEPTEQDGGLSSVGLMMRDGNLKSGFGPYRARGLFKVQLNREDGLSGLLNAWERPAPPWLTVEFFVLAANMKILTTPIFVFTTS